MLVVDGQGGVTTLDLEILTWARERFLGRKLILLAVNKCDKIDDWFEVVRWGTIWYGLSSPLVQAS